MYHTFIHKKKEAERIMRFGAMNFPLNPVLEEIEAVAEMGFDYVELTMDAPMAHHSVLKEQQDAVLSAIRRLGLGLVCHLPTFVSAADLTPGLREASVRELVESLETAKALGTEKVVLHPAHASGLGRRALELFRRHMRESLSTVLLAAQSLDVRVGLENMPPIACSLSDPEDFTEVFHQFPHLEMTLDLGHAHIDSPGGQRNLAFIERFAGRIGHVHASDNRGSADDHLPVGVGSLDFPCVIRALHEIGYDDTMTLEVFSQDREYLMRSRDKIAGMLERAGGKRR
jgi:sugar phosphate isomerase/epimerase